METNLKAWYDGYKAGRQMNRISGDHIPSVTVTCWDCDGEGFDRTSYQPRPCPTCFGQAYLEVTER